MAEMYLGGRGSLDLCADMAETGDLSTVPPGPVVGVNVQVDGH